MKVLETIAQLLTMYPDNKVMFEEPVQVKPTPHRLVFTAYGAWLGADGVYLLDGAGDWHGPLNESQSNASFVIASIYQRLKLSPGLQLVNN